MIIRVHRSFVSLCLVAAGLICTPAAFGQMINWTSRYAPNYVESREVTFGQGLYVAVGDESTTLYSRDGINWQNGNLPPGLSCNLKTVAYAFGQFFAGGVLSTGGRGVLLLSLDGINWHEITDQFPSEGGLARVNELFTATLNGQQTLLASVDIADMFHKGSVFASSDGASWIPSYRYNSAHAGNFFQDGSAVFGLEIPDAWHAAFVNWGTVTWGGSRINPSASITSFSDIWSMPKELTRFAFGNATYVGVGAARKLAFAGNTSAAFTYTSSPLISNYTGVAFGRDTFVAVGSSGAVVVSYDLGRKWNAVAGLGLQQITLNGVRFVGGKFIAFGGGRIVTGTPVNKRSWAESPLPNGTLALNGVATNGTVLVAVGARGQILYSTTGVVWQRTPPATSRALYRVDYDPVTKLFFATGEAGTLLRSRDGWNWVATATGYGGDLNGVGRSGGRLVAGSGTAGRFISSTDGVRWQAGASSLLNFGRSFSDTGSIWKNS